MNSIFTTFIRNCKAIWFIKKKNFWNYFLIATCSLYCGFILGNLFGTFLNLLRTKITWDFNILIIIIFIFEILNYFIYKKKIFNTVILIILKNFQIGLLFGFFIDAFKVGS
uniref:Ycf20 n=1 Tax=Pseudochlorodesmis sp. HV01306a TaxID=2358488 RepID=A0A386AY22_9CHLO|nr:hypothetical protein Ycf20 [Pseudochlorodesmis sp. HV01306a]